MPTPSNTWKPGRGKLGRLQPLLGSWEASTESPMGVLRCTREFSLVLGGNYVQLAAAWKMPGKVYEEHAIFGADSDGTLSFWSFTSDGKRSEGKLCEALEVHPKSLAFEAEMRAGTARMIYWPHETNGFLWAVESKTKKGWNRFTLHHYRAATSDA
jgi:hypothetical protein